MSRIQPIKFLQNKDSNCSLVNTLEAVAKPYFLA